MRDKGTARLMRIVIVTAAIAASSAARAQGMTEEEYDDAAACWGTTGASGERRSLCLGADKAVRLVSHRTSTGSSCASYPATTVTIEGTAIVVNVPRGSGNCKSARGKVQDSVSGRFRCEHDSKRQILTCRVSWEGRAPVIERYRRLHQPPPG
jgi:hypothetical protein